ncbi:hypothetical protein LJC26_04535 [Desulfovibrio sp. OttesenSCG-928-O18]|nr:hypothetical protein [Desulfovibrio sp. OttesenSCG-928-O18]
MATNLPHSVEFKAQIIKAMLSNAPAAMEFAERYGLSPAEIRDIIHDAILHLDEPLEGNPITAHPPPELKRMTSKELHLLLGEYPDSNLH